MTLKPGLAKHLKELEQKVFEMGSRSYVPGTTASSHSTTAPTTTTTTTSSGGGGGGGGGQSDAELPQAVQRSLKDMKFEAVRLKKAGDREGAKEKLRLVRCSAIETISTLGASHMRRHPYILHTNSSLVLVALRRFASALTRSG
jgi:hypothetical protein